MSRSFTISYLGIYVEKRVSVLKLAESQMFENVYLAKGNYAIINNKFFEY